MRSNNNDHNKYFSVDAASHQRQLRRLSVLLWSASVIFMQTGPMKKLKP